MACFFLIHSVAQNTLQNILFLLIILFFFVPFLCLTTIGTRAISALDYNLCWLISKSNEKKNHRRKERNIWMLLSEILQPFLCYIPQNNCSVIIQTCADSSRPAVCSNEIEQPLVDAERFVVVDVVFFSLILIRVICSRATQHLSDGLNDETESNRSARIKPLLRIWQCKQHLQCNCSPVCSAAHWVSTANAAQSHKWVEKKKLSV